MTSDSYPGIDVCMNSLTAPNDDRANSNSNNTETPTTTTTIDEVTSAGHSLQQLSRDKQRLNDVTQRWLEDNYVVCDGFCLPRNLVYSHYVDFCSKLNVTPSCSATFGKTVRLKFPHVTTRRLGTRGHSRYHYYGIAVRETSSYFCAINRISGLTRFSGAKFTSEGGFTTPYSLSSKVGTVFPDFKSVQCLDLPVFTSRETVDALLQGYSGHCQVLLDSIICGNFSSIETHMLQFWTSLPSGLAQLLQHDAISDAICASDCILHKTLIDILIPATMQEMPETLLSELTTLARCWVRWVTSAVSHVAASSRRFVNRKLTADRTFASSLQRHVTFLRLAQTVRPVLYDARLVHQIISDIDQVDLTNVTNPYSDQCWFRLHRLQQPTSSPLNSICSPHAVRVNQLSQTRLSVGDEAVLMMLQEFREMLHKQATVEAFVEWLDASIEQKILAPSRRIKENTTASLKQISQTFLLQWSFYGTRLAHCLTLNNARSFIAIHLIHMMLTEYLLLAIESNLMLDRPIRHCDDARAANVLHATSANSGSR